MKIRKQVYELTNRDLLEQPVWEFAIDEEGEAGQDEATVRPVAREELSDPTDAMFVVRANFTLADGTTYLGYLTPATEEDTSIGTIQPIIVTDAGQVGFWFGVMAPSTASIREAYDKLGRKADQVFPISFVSDVEVAGGPVSGSLNGFMYLRSFEDHTVVEVK
jgi:hypothetical protein